MSDHSHTHVTEQGTLVRCWHSCKNVMLSVPFWLGITISYPFEHFLWEKVIPFKWVTEWMHSDDKH